MKAHGIKKKDGIAMLLDQPTHKTIHENFRKIDPSTPQRTALYKSVRKIKEILENKGIYNMEWNDALRNIIQRNLDKFPHLFKK